MILTMVMMMENEFDDLEFNASEEANKYTPEIIASLSDKFFPFRDGNKPKYRKHQRDTIINICSAFLIKGKKFVAVEGPVGCGKSVINYTVARIMGNTVYLTPLKMLQDQISMEGWDGVKMGKGRSAYACNHCSYEDTRYRCTYDKDDKNTCNNSPESVKIGPQTFMGLAGEIKKVHEKFKGDEYTIRLRSGFSSPEEFLERKAEMIGFIMESKRRFVEIFGRDPNNVSYDYDLEKNVCCTKSVVECPVKSSRLLLKMAPVKILNPDLFFMMNKHEGSYYTNSEMMVYDECQQIEDVVARIFTISLPIETIRSLFGIDLNFIYESPGDKKSMIETIEKVRDIIGPAVAVARTISRMGEICSVRNFPTFERMKSMNIFAEIMRSSEIGKESIRDFLFKKWRDEKNYEFSIIDIIDKRYCKNATVPDVFEKLLNGISSYYKECCARLGCKEDYNYFKLLIDYCKGYFGELQIQKLRKLRTKILEVGERSSYTDKDVIVSENFIFFDHISVMANTVEPFIMNIVDLSDIDSSEFPSFVIDKNIGNTLRACAGTDLYDMLSEDSFYKDQKEKCISVIPIDIGRIMNKFFYSKTKHVLLTSGTWVCPESLFKLYGLPNDTEFIKIPSTFDPKRRPIYVVDNNDEYTNYSAKDDDGIEYIYKTEKGTKRFAREVDHIINSLRRHIKNTYKENANIIIHCHTFDIAKRLAENSRLVDNKFLIHLPGGSMSIENKHTGFSVAVVDKDSLIQTIKEQPNSDFILLSPSISEGVDFKDKIARAQIILKRPIPYLGDAYVRSYYKGNPDVGIEADPDYLDRVCYTMMTQQYGRIMRSEKDWGITVIMDQSIAMSLKGLLRSKSRIQQLNISYLIDGIRYKGAGVPQFLWYEKQA